MEAPQSNKSFGAELKRFAENIDIHQFRPLSAGIGLGFVTRQDPSQGLQKPYSQGRSPDAYASTSEQFNSEPQHRPPEPSVQLRRLFPNQEVIVPQPLPNMQPLGEAVLGSAMHPDLVATPSAEKKGRWRRTWRMIRLILVHGIDLFAVAFSLIAALLVGAWFLAPDGNTFAVRVLKWTPVSEITHLSIIELGIGVYLLFGMYWAFFKLVVGFTIGQGIFRITTRPHSIRSGGIENRGN